jgi:hypothetical protein
MIRRLHHYLYLVSGLLLNGAAKHGSVQNGTGPPYQTTAPDWRELITTKLFFKRVGLVSLMVSMFIVGLICRLTLNPQYHHRELLELCRPFQSTFTNHTTMADLANKLIDNKVANATFEYTTFILDQCIEFLKTYTPPIV